MEFPCSTDFLKPGKSKCPMAHGSIVAYICGFRISIGTMDDPLYSKLDVFHFDS